MINHTIGVNQCGAHLAVNSKEELLDEVAARIAQATDLTQQRVRQALSRREEQGSTGLARGIALPHCALPEMERFAVGIITLSQPIAFGALDGQPSDLFAYVAGPEQARSEHVRILAALTANLRKEEHAHLIREERDAGRIARIAQEWITPTTPDQSDRYTMLIVYVQDKEMYEPILETISAEPHASVAISAAKSARSVLYRVPLFATFWGNQETQEIDRIEAILPRDCVNRTIRRIEELSKGRVGVQISAVDLSYSSGLLDL